MSFRRQQPPAPKGYVAGLGRGAAGFTTRSDIGPAAAVAESGTGSRSALARKSLFGQAPKGYVAGAGRGAGSMAGGGEDGPTGGNSFEGNDGRPSAASSATPYDQDDEEADDIYAAVEERMKRRKRKKNGGDENDENGDEDADEQQLQSVKIKTQFRDLKQQLSTVTDDQWAAIPEVGDYSLKHKQKQRREDVFTPLSDSLLESRTLANQDATASSRTAPAANTTVDDGFASVANMSGLAQARGTVLGMSLDRMSDSVTGQTVVDPQGYLTSLSTQSSANAQVGDIQKARLLLKSVRDTNPKHGPGWIAAARVEEASGKTLQARKVIQEGCKTCPTNEDVWLEAARLHPLAVAKSILATAARRIPTSTKIFLKAADLEVHVDTKKQVLRKALAANPTSVQLWKAAIELEQDVEDAKLLLQVAVEKVPHSMDMWLALARLESYQKARQVLNQARKALPAERSIWIAAAKLEESQNHVDIVDKIIDKAVKSLQKHNAVVTRPQWLDEAVHAEASGAPLTAAAIVKHTIDMGIDPEDRFRTWAADAKQHAAAGAVATARAILAQALATFPTKQSLWMQAVDLERTKGTAESLDEVLREASKRLPKVEIFWLFRAKEQWVSQGNIDAAREILTQAFRSNPNSEQVWLAAAKLEWETGEMERARVLLERARERASSGRVYMKSALLERQEEKYADALALIDEGIEKYPTFAKLHMMGGQICSEKDHTKSSLDKARKYYQRGLSDCPNNTVLWLLASRLEERAHTFDTTKAAAAGITKARSLLELARLKNSKNPELWLEAIRLERRANNAPLAATLMARALQQCPNAGPLLAETIATAPRVSKKSKAATAIQRCPEDAHVMCAVAGLFASEGKLEKARKWYDKAVTLNSDYGDFWARYYLFELKQHEKKKSDKVETIKKRCIQAEPKHGEVWPKIMKETGNHGKSVGEGLELVAQEIVRREEEDAKHQAIS